MNISLSTSVIRAAKTDRPTTSMSSPLTYSNHSKFFMLSEATSPVEHQRQNLPPPIIYGTNLQAVQPGSGVPKSRFNFFRKSTPQFIDPQTSEAKDYLGKVNFSVSYEKDSHTMNVLILEAVDLPAKDLTGSSDPYVRVCLLPDTGVYQRTKVHRRNLNPKFQQTLSFPGNVSRT
uniref:C2 domain-containing protein n=1 Tax=Plectus sambesii TaxID=2011161 RepID=A0A914WDL9_9BILA